MKKLLLFLFISAILGGLAIWWNVNSRPFSTSTTMVNFIIPKGSSAISIGQKLEKEKLIKNSLVFKLFVQITGKQNRILAGEYRIPPSFSLEKVVELLTKGPAEIWVTIPEGLRREEVAGKFISGLGIDDLRADQFRKEFINASVGKEGYLFPDTYLLAKDASASAIVAKMYSTFNKKVTSKMANDALKNKITLTQAIVMASLIERETNTSEERPIVAGILYRRMKMNIPLQLDATVQYAVANLRCKVQGGTCNNWWPQTTLEDRKISSPFNTYRIKNLPPSPVANPGLSSIQAAIYPQDSDYLYYLHDSQGQIHYGRTLEEHNQNIARYIR